MHQNALLKMSTRGLPVTQHLPAGEMELEGNLYSNNKPFTLWSFTRNGLMAVCQSLSGTLLFSLHREKEWV